MLQQTQVATVRTYFMRFLERFPDVNRLAEATLDEVLGLWSGLGYYSRARNLHRCAQLIMVEHHGAFPQQARTLETLPGIGRSTAAAIASLCFGERVAILDANVKRVLTRVLGFDADLALAVNERALWDAATFILPAHQVSAANMAGYTQGMMDLGAMVCLPKNPLCRTCAVRPECKAAAQGDPLRYPVRSRKVRRSSEFLWLLRLRAPDGSVWLRKRPEPGVWAGLYCLPWFESEQRVRGALSADLKDRLRTLPAFRHVLTHKDLHLHPCAVNLPDTSTCWGEGRWVTSHEWPNLGLPAPIRTLLATPDDVST